MRIFDVAYNIIGGGEEGAKVEVSTKEEADHSLPYILAVALLDGDVMPAQYAPSRITRGDVQSLLKRVRVSPDPGFSAAFPASMPCAIAVELESGEVLEGETKDYEGFLKRPMSRDSSVAKFDKIARSKASERLRSEIVDAVAGLEDIRVGRLTSLLGRRD